MEKKYSYNKINGSELMIFFTHVVQWLQSKQKQVTRNAVTSVFVIPTLHYIIITSSLHHHYIIIISLRVSQVEPISCISENSFGKGGGRASDVTKVCVCVGGGEKSSVVSDFLTKFHRFPGIFVGFSLIFRHFCRIFINYSSFLSDYIVSSTLLLFIAS